MTNAPTDQHHDDAAPLPDLPARDRPERRLTHDIPGTGGVLRERPEDFIVEELPLYEPCGEGEHLYLFVEKRNISTMHLIVLLAKHFGVQKRAVGVAGLKDRHAVTRQLVSIHMPGRSAEDVPAFEHDGVSILWADRHANKLRRGHLAGNRFVIRVRKADPFGARAARASLERLARRGIPNRLGEQRFGYTRTNHLLGRAMLLGRWREACDHLLGPAPVHLDAQAKARDLYAAGEFASARNAFPRSAHTERHALRTLAHCGDFRLAILNLESRQREFYITAFQSAVFNAVLDRRLEDDTFDALRIGDLAMIHDRRACFAIDAETLGDPSTSERLASMQISPTGPMWGRQMTRTEGEVGELELDALREAGVSPDVFDRRDDNPLRDIRGERRPLRVPVSLIDVEGGADEHGPFIRCAFDLPRGSFATVVMDEIMKNDAARSADEDSAAGVRAAPQRAGPAASNTADDDGQPPPDVGLSLT